MEVQKNNVISINYTLSGDDGEVLDSSIGGEPLEFLCGHDQIIVGLENALLGKKTGDKVKVHIKPEDGYGDYNAELVHKVPKSQIETDAALEVGIQFQVDAPDGPEIYTVTKVEGNEVTLDGNHPLAGQSLNFDVEIMGVRQASSDELAHGHIHGESCHH